MIANPNVITSDVAVVAEVARLLAATVDLPVGQLEHAVQVAHESTPKQKHDPTEVFAELGVTRQELRMFWHFRCNLDAVRRRGG